MPSRPALVPAAVLALMIGYGCDESPEQERQEIAVAELEVLESTPFETAPDDPIGAIDDMAVSRGLWYLADGIQSNIKVFDRDGTLVRTIGGPGDGPGEFRFPRAMAFAGDTLLVLDAGRSQVNVFGPSSVYLRSWPVAGVFLADLLVVRDEGMNTQVAVSTKTRGDAGSPGAREISVFDLDGKLLRRFGDLEPAESPRQTSFRTVMLAGTDRWVAMVSHDTDRIQIFDWSGEFQGQAHAGAGPYEEPEWSQRLPAGVTSREWVEGKHLLWDIMPFGSDQILARFDRFGVETDRYFYVLMDVSNPANATALAATDFTNAHFSATAGDSLYGHEWADDGTVNLVVYRLMVPDGDVE